MFNVGVVGIYILEVMNNDNGCMVMDQVVVFVDSDVFIVQIDFSDILDCNISIFMFDVLGLLSGMNFFIIWSIVDGNFVSGMNGLQFIVDQFGIYMFVIVDIGNGCSNDVIIMVV